MTRNQKIRALVSSGLAAGRADAIAQLEDMGEDEDDDDETAEHEDSPSLQDMGMELGSYGS